MRAKLVGVALGAAMLVAFVLPAQPAAAWNFMAYGTAYCINGDDVVGVWVNAGTQSGWADYTPSRGDDWSSVTYRRDFSASSYYSIDVGCGGTEANWASNNHSWRVANWPFTNPTWQCGNGSCITYEASE